MRQAERRIAVALLLCMAACTPGARAPEGTTISDEQWASYFQPPADSVVHSRVGCYRFAYSPADSMLRQLGFPMRFRLTGRLTVPTHAPELVWRPRVEVPHATPLVHGDTLYWNHFSDSLIVVWQWGNGAAILIAPWREDTLVGRLSLHPDYGVHSEWRAVGHRIHCATAPS